MLIFIGLAILTVGAIWLLEALPYDVNPNRLGREG